MLNKNNTFLLLITTVLLLMITDLSSVEKIFCDQCENFIEPGTRYITSNGKNYCDQVCFDKSLPKCVVCGEPVKNGFRSKGKKYCSEECLSSTWDKCELCGKRINAGFHIGNKNGAFFCKDCMDKPKCFLCGHPDNCKTLSDGRLICSNCDKSAISDPTEARNILDEVRLKMSEVMNLNTDHDIKFKLVSVQELDKEFNSISSDENMEQGLFIHEERTRTYVKTKSIFGFEFGKETKTEVINNYSILMLFSLTKEKFIEVAAHELAHDWMQAHYPKINDLMISEGWAEFVASQVNDHYGNTHLNARMKNNSSPTYGEGYRFIAGYVVEHGVKGLYELFADMSKK